MSTYLWLNIRAQNPKKTAKFKPPCSALLSPPSFPGCSFWGSNPAPPPVKLPLSCLTAPPVMICHPQPLLSSQASALIISWCLSAPSELWAASKGAEELLGTHGTGLPRSKKFPLHLDCSQNKCRFPPGFPRHFVEDVSTNGFHEKVSGGRLQRSAWKDFRTKEKKNYQGL